LKSVVHHYFARSLHKNTALLSQILGLLLISFSSLDTTLLLSVLPCPTLPRSGTLHVEWYWHHLHIYLHETGSDTVAIIQITEPVVIVTVKVVAEKSKSDSSGSGGDVDDGDKGGKSLSQQKKRRKDFGSVSPLNQHGTLLNHKSNVCSIPLVIYQHSTHVIKRRKREMFIIA